MQRAYTLGLAYAAKGDAKHLAEQVEALKKLKESSARTAQAELEGHQLLAKGEVGPAFDQFAKATAMRAEALARAHLTARNYGFAESVAKKAVDQNPEQVPPMAAYVEILQAAGKEKEAQQAYARLAPMARWADRDLPVFRRLDGHRRPLEGRQELEGPRGDAEPPGRVGRHRRGGDQPDRPDHPRPARLDALPRRAARRRPTRPASPGRWPTTRGGRSSSSSSWAASVPTACSSSRSSARSTRRSRSSGWTRSPSAPTTPRRPGRLKNNADGVKFPMPMIADPKLEAFRRYRVYDDFEGQPLHGTFLIDARGNVRFQRISADPFLDVEFIKAEAARVGRIVK